MIILRKNGIFYENEYKPEHERYVYKEIESIVPYLNDTIETDEDFTLEDFFKIVESDKETMEVVFSSYLGHFSLTPFIEEINKDCLAESKEDMDFIECSWSAEQFNYNLFYDKHKDDDEDGIIKSMGHLSEPEEEVNEISINVDVHGWGEHDEEDRLNKDRTHTSFAIEFTPLYRLKHLPIRLDKLFTIRDQEENDIVIEGEREFTVFEIFGAILSEITFCGLPEDRDAKWKDIVDEVDETKEQFGEDKEE